MLCFHGYMFYYMKGHLSIRKKKHKKRRIKIENLLLLIYYYKIQN